MRKAKNRTMSNSDQKDKRFNQKCEQCGGMDVALAAKMVRGRIKWICYSCYKGGAKK